MFGGLFITKGGYFLIEKYKFAYVIIFIVFSLALLNLISGIFYVSIESKRFGFDS